MVGTLGGGAVRSVSITNGGILIHYSFGIPLGSNRVAGSGEVITTLPAVGCLVTRNTGIVLYSRLNEPGNRCGPRFDLTPMTGELARCLNRSIGLTRSRAIMNRGTGGVTTRLGSNRIVLLRGIHCEGRRAGGRRGFSGRLTSLTSIFIGSTFNATRETRYSAANITTCLPTIYNCLVRGRVAFVNNTLSSPGHPLITVLNNTGISSGVNMVAGLLSGYSALVINNNVTCAFVGTLNRRVNASLLRRSRIRGTYRVVGSTRTGNIGFLVPISGGINGRCSRGARTVIMGDSRVPSN